MKTCAKALVRLPTSNNNHLSLNLSLPTLHSALKPYRLSYSTMATIAKTEAYLVNLKSLVESEDTLSQNGYVIQPLTDTELLQKQRCSACNKGDNGTQRFFDNASTRSNRLK